MEYVAEVLIFAVFAMSLNLLVGYAGQVSVAHAAFGAFGGYTATALAASLHAPWAVAVLCGIVAASAAGLLVGLPALRLGEDYLILLTLAVQSIVITFVGASPNFGGPYGQPTGDVVLFGAHLSQPADFVPSFAVLGILVGIACWRIGQSPFGRILKGIRQDEVLTQSLGKRIYRSKLIVFTVTAAFAGLAGAMLVMLSSIATPQLFSFDQSVAIFAMVIIGGRGNLLGSVLGAALLVLLTPLLEVALNLAPEEASFAREIVFGLVLLAVVWIRPQGILPEITRRRADRSVTLDDAERPVGAPTERAALDSPVVQVSSLSKSFGGIRAASSLDFELTAGRITALIGPNGAGKSTVFGLLTGAIRADAGQVLLHGHDISAMSPDRIARRGMVRSFQHVRLIPRLSCLENVMLAVPGQRGEAFSDLWIPGRSRRRDDAATRREALRWLDYVGLADRAGRNAGDLSFGDQKLLSLARTLATRADVLLLDEPASGIEGEMVERLLGLIRRACSDGRTVCIVEHNLELVRRIADHVIFLELGQITARGDYADLVEDPRLVEAYFGTQ